MSRIFLSITLITMVTGALAFGATKAFFSDIEISAANAFTAGAIDLKVDNESYYNGESNGNTSWAETDLTVEKFFDFEDLKPGDYGEDTISLHVQTNEAFMCASVTLTSNDDNGLTEPEALVDNTEGPQGEGELADLVNFVWWADDGDNVFESDEEIIAQGPIGGLTLDQTHPLTLADSDENIWTGIGGPVPGNETLYLGKAWCFGTIGTDAVAQDGENDVLSPASDNNDNNIEGEPEDGGITCDGSSLGNESQTDSLTADIAFEVVQARHNSDFQCAAPQIACTPEQAFADHVVSFSQGTNKDGSPISPSRSDPTYALGAPESTGTPYDSPIAPNSFFSLGFNVGSSTGGEIVVEFTDNYIVDGPGNDLKIWEITGGSNYPDEHVRLYASQNGTDWHLIAADLTRDAEADLGSSGLTWAKYIKMVEVSSPDPFTGGADGYDLDAFSALNCAQIPTVD